jgi:hypothetical protein
MAGVRHFSVDGSAFRISMGLHRLALAEWIETDGDYHDDLALKEELLAQRADEVAAFLPAGAAGSAEALDLLRAHMANHHPELTPTPPPGDDVDEHPLITAARMVQEDLCVMHRTADGWVLAAAVVCFPSRWSLRDKLGQDLTAIHDPVPRYRERLADPARRFFDRMVVQRPMWRLNWTLLDDPALHQPSASAAAARVPPADLTVRVERQTLRRLPRSGDVLFTIRTYRGRLGDVAADRLGLAADLAATLRTVPADHAAYRGWTPHLPGLLEWLARRSEVDDGLAADVAGE